MPFRKGNEEPVEFMLRNKIILTKVPSFWGLNWKEHIKKLIAKEKRVLNICVVTGRKWEGVLKTLKKLYSVIFRTKMN